MTKFLTVTLSPAIDKTYLLTKPLALGALNRLPKPDIAAGSKGINSARLIKLLGGDVTALSFGSDNSAADGYAGRLMETLLMGEGLNVCLVPTAAGVRTNVKLIYGDEGTEQNEPGGPVTQAELEALVARYTGALSSDCCVLLGGSIPQGVDKSVYNRLIDRAKAAGATVALDCDGEAFKQGVNASPHLVKPNAHELGEYFSTEISTIPQARFFAERLYAERSVSVLCTMGKTGAVYVGKEGIFAATPPRVTVRGFAGAGDCFLGAFVFEYARTHDAAAALRLATAAGSAKTATVGTNTPPLSLIREYADTVTVERMDG